MNNSDGKASLKRQKSLETTTDTGCEQVLLISRVKCSYLEIFIVVNRPHFVPHTIPYNVFKFSTVPSLLNTESHNAVLNWPSKVFSSQITCYYNQSLAFSRDVSLGRLWSFCELHYFRSVIFWYNLRQVWRLNKSVKVSKVGVLC